MGDLQWDVSVLGLQLRRRFKSQACETHQPKDTQRGGNPVHPISSLQLLQLLDSRSSRRIAFLKSCTLNL